MKIFGIILVVVGLIWAVIAFNMQTTVTSPSQSFGSGDYAIETPSVTVNNIGLMDQRRNNLMFAGLTILVGAVFIGFGSLSRKAPIEGSDIVACPYCAELVKPEAVVCKHCGRDIGTALAERRQSDAQARTEAAERQRAALEQANQSKGLELCARLREGALNYDEYQQLARVAGASLGVLWDGPSTRYVITRGKDKVRFERLEALRPWFLENVAPKVESDA